MSDSEVRLEFVGKLGEEFVERVRRGEHPSIREYTDKYPEHQAEIAELFPALAMMEDLAPAGSASLAGKGVESSAARGAIELDQLGDYRIIREIGRGGMGIVYEAEQVSLGRHVALKVLPKELLSNRKQRLRFEREAKAAARLHHTNIVPVFGVGEDDDMSYYVMQFIQGLGLDVVVEELKRMNARPGSSSAALHTGELRIGRRDVSAADVAHSLMNGTFGLHGAPADDALGQRLIDATLPVAEEAPATQPRPPAIAAGRLSDTLSLSNSSVIMPGSAPGRSGQTSKAYTYWQSVAHIGVQVAEALQYAHTQGVLHRDIKPSNLLLDMRGTVWVTDFGLAKLDDDRGLTQTGDVLGTLRYMAPETFKGQTDARSELYSMGLTLYELVAFRPAFDQTNRNSLLDQVMNAQVEPLRKLNREIPADLQTIIHKAIDRDPQHRYQSARELADDLQRFIDDEPIKARRISSVERLSRWSRHNKGLAVSLAAVAALLLVINISWPILTWRMARLNSDLEKSKAELSKTVVKLSETADDLMVSRNDAQKRAAENLELARVAQASQRGEAALRSLAEDREKVLQTTLYAAEMNLAAQASQDPTGLLRVGQITEKWTPDRVSRDLRGWEWYYLDSLRRGDRLTVKSSFAECVDWSPDGKRFAGGCRDGILRIWDAATGSLLRELVGHTSYVVSVAWSPDGSRIATASRDKTIRIWDAATGRSLSVLKGHSVFAYSVCWSPDGLRLASTASDFTGELFIWNATTGQTVIRQETRGAEARVSWNPKSQQVATIGAVYDAATGAKLWTHPGWRMCWSPDGKRLAVLMDSRAQILSAEDGTKLVELAGHPERHRAVDWSPGGELLAIASDDNMVSIWDTSTGTQLSVLRGHTDWVLDVKWSRDGKQLATAGDKTFKIWDWPVRRNPEVVPSRTSSPRSIAWSNDGSTIAVGGLDGVMTCDVDTLQTRLCVNGLAGKATIFTPSIGWHPASHVFAARRARATVLFDDQTWQARREIKDLDLDVRALDLSPDGTRIATSAWNNVDGDQSVVRAFRTATGEELWVARLHSDLAGSIRFSPDGTRLACGGWASVAIIDGNNGQLLCSYPASHERRWIYSTAWDPSSRRVAIASMDRSIHIFDAAQGKEQLTLIGHTDEVLTVSWSPDGSRIASGGKDHTVRVWDARTGTQLVVLRGHTTDVNSVAWSPDGLRLASGSADGQLRIWDAFKGYAHSGPPAVVASIKKRLAANPDRRQVTSPGSFGEKSKKTPPRRVPGGVDGT